MDRYLSYFLKAAIRPFIHRLCTSLVLTLFATCVLAQPMDGIAGRYPSGSIKSLEQADTALADVGRESSEIESRFALEEQACNPQFFATSCLDKAKERRRASMMVVRRIEIEAQTFKRRARLAERDQALDERRMKDEKARQERLREQREPGDGAERQVPAGPAATMAANSLPPTGNIVQKAGEQHEAVNKIQPKAIPGDAEKRAEKLAAYERKVQAARDRQKELAKRKAEKERKRELKGSAMPQPQ